MYFGNARVLEGSLEAGMQKGAGEGARATHVETTQLGAPAWPAD